MRTLTSDKGCSKWITTVIILTLFKSNPCHFQMKICDMLATSQLTCSDKICWDLTTGLTATTFCILWCNMIKSITEPSTQQLFIN
jgi:hypothetical protein